MTLAVILLIGAFVLLVAFRVPISFSLAVATVFFLAAALASEGQTFEIILQRLIFGISMPLYSGVDKFALLAIPFFILAGLLMGRGGIATRLIDLANVLVGAFVGGLVHVNVLACMFFGAISGSATAATSSIGSFLIPIMEKQGYERQFSVALTMTAATTGLIIPPSNVMIVYSVAAGQVSIAAMFMAGFLPGILLGLCLMVVGGFIAVRRHYPPAGAVPLAEAWPRFQRAFLSLLMIVIVLGGILGGVFTATEASAIAVVYAFFLSFFVYRSVKWADLPGILLQAGITTAFIMFLIGCSTAMGQAITLYQLPDKLSMALLSLTDSRFLLLLLINGILLLVGVFMDMTPAVLIFTPIFLPIAVKSVAQGGLGLHPVHFGIILITNLCIGLCTPPVGTVLFVGCGVGKTSIDKVIRSLIPFYVAMVAALLAITYMPQKIILWLPRLFGLVQT